jgi:hypothetical protein
MSSVRIATVSLSDTESATMDWVKDGGYVVALQTALGNGESRSSDHTAYPDVPTALRGLADLVEQREP